MQSPPAGQLSPDGMWRWDGSAWQPLAGALPPTQAPRRSTRSWLATVGGIAALAAIAFIVAGCIFPFVYYSDTSAGGPSSSSVFNVGYSGGLFFALEPLAVMGAAGVAAVLLIASQSRAVRAVGAGVLLALGVQTTTLFIGYIGGEVAYGRVGAGGPLGTAGGIFLVIGGALAVGSLLQWKPEAT